MRAIIIGLRIHLKAAVAVPTLLLLSVAVFHAQAAVRTWTRTGF